MSSRGPLEEPSDTALERVVLTADELYQLLAHLITSAEICTTEPWYYGTFRLIDAASRLSARSLARGFDDPWLREFQAELEAKKRWMIWNRPAYFDFLGLASRRLAEHLLERESDAHSPAAAKTAPDPAS
ncbi:MAG: DUF6092 family protein [Candidatus Dormibacteria bacterium]